jgi:hypothetical protein
MVRSERSYLQVVWYLWLEVNDHIYKWYDIYGQKWTILSTSGMIFIVRSERSYLQVVWYLWSEVNDHIYVDNYVWIPTICLEVGICEETHTRGGILVGICQGQYERVSIRLIASIIKFVCLVISTILTIFIFFYISDEHVQFRKYYFDFTGNILFLRKVTLIMAHQVSLAPSFFILKCLCQTKKVSGHVYVR